MPQNPTPRERANEALGEPVENWIDRHRNSAAQLTYGQLRRVLSEEYGIEVSRQTVWFWHTEGAGTEPAEPNGSAA